MSKPNSLLEDLQENLKIDKGLKLLQFATQYNIRQIFYRNCPLNNCKGQQLIKSKKVNSNIIQQKNKKADLMAQLNEQIINNKYESSSKYIPASSISNLELPASSNFKNVGGKSVQIHQSEKSNASHQVSHQSKSDEEFDLQDVAAYDSDQSRKEKPMPVIKQVSHQSQIIDQPKQKSIQHLTFTKKASFKEQKPINFSDLQSYLPSIDMGQYKIPQIITKTISVKEKSKVQIKQASNSKSKSLSRSANLMNNSISLIKMSGQKSSSHRISQQLTQMSILKQISQSFLQKDHINLLLKLQSSQLQQRFLQQRMRKRTQKMRKDISKLKDITWQSLQLPKPKYQFKKLNYAHLIE